MEPSARLLGGFLRSERRHASLGGLIAGATGTELLPGLTATTNYAETSFERSLALGSFSFRGGLGHVRLISPGLQKSFSDHLRSDTVTWYDTVTMMSSTNVVPSFTSTTAVLRWAYEQTNGNLREAMVLLFGAAGRSAYRVLETKLRKHPGSTTFLVERRGFVVLA